MYGYIYETTNLINKMKYIGKHRSDKFDTKYYGSGKSFLKDFTKLGADNFRIRILEECNNQKDLDLRETYYIILFNAVRSSMYYNNSYGGENEGWQGVNKMFKDNPEKWIQSRLKASITLTGQKRSDITKSKISKALKGKPKSEEHKQHLRHAKYNLSEEQRHKIGLNFSTLGKPSPIRGLNASNSEHVRKCRDGEIKTKNSEKWKNTKGLIARQKLSKTRIEKGLAKGKNNPMYGTKTVYVSNRELDLVKRIPIEQFEEYLLSGWTKGNIHKMK